MQVRPYRADDADACARIQVDGWRTAYRGLVGDAFLDDPAFADRRREWWRTRQPLEEVEVDVAVAGAGIVGWSSFGPARTTSWPVAETAYDDDPALGELWALYVDPAAWGSGAGDALMRRALAGLADRGRTRVVLWVLEGNGRARRFYARYGFAPTGSAQPLDLGPAGGRPVEVQLVRNAPAAPMQ